MNLNKMIEICLKDDNMHIFVMIKALICINNYIIICINSMLSQQWPNKGGSGGPIRAEKEKGQWSSWVAREKKRRAVAAATLIEQRRKHGKKNLI